jgi:hypothetical protein
MFPVGNEVTMVVVMSEFTLARGLVECDIFIFTIASGFCSSRSRHSFFSLAVVGD